MKKTTYSILKSSISNTNTHSIPKNGSYNMSFLSNLAAFFKFLAGLIVGLLVSFYYQLKSIFLFFIPKCLRFKDVSNDLVLITGGASGLGRLTAIKMAKLGAKVIIWDLNLAGLEETAKLIEELRSKRENVGKCYCYQVDIGNRANVYATAERIKQEIGTVTIVFNNAGVVTGKRFLECTDDQILKTFNVNTLAHFWVGTLLVLLHQLLDTSILMTPQRSSKHSYLA